MHRRNGPTKTVGPLRHGEEVLGGVLGENEKVRFARVKPLHHLEKLLVALLLVVEKHLQALSLGKCLELRILAKFLRRLGRVADDVELRQEMLQRARGFVRGHIYDRGCPDWARRTFLLETGRSGRRKLSHISDNEIQAREEDRDGDECVVLREDVR